MKATTKVIRELLKRNPNEVLVKSPIGSGSARCKLPQGSTVGDALTALYYIFADLSVDLGFVLDPPTKDFRDRLKEEMWA